MKQLVNKKIIVRQKNLFLLFLIVCYSVKVGTNDVLKSQDEEKRNYRRESSEEVLINRFLLSVHLTKNRDVIINKAGQKDGRRKNAKSKRR